VAGDEAENRPAPKRSDGPADRKSATPQTSSARYVVRIIGLKRMSDAEIDCRKSHHEKRLCNSLIASCTPASRIS
jgi:hypothetical protein